jgi:protein SCO1/2
MPKQLKILLIALWVVVGLTVGGVVAGVLWYRSNQPAASAVTFNNDPTAGNRHLDKLYDTPAFTLTDQDAKPFDSQKLHGKVWVADFVFTNCTSFCPMMTQQMADFQNRTAGTDIQMVSFSVDPERDTPAVLAAYANNAKADLTRWHFLTGDKEMIWRISENGMKLAVGPGDGSDHQVMHSSHFLLVDANGAVRGIYDYKDAGFMAKLVADAKKLTTTN